MKKLIPVIIIFSLILSACSLFPLNQVEKPLSDAEMATRVAELLATMTTPTTEVLFPPTPTVGLPTISIPTATVETPVVVTTEPPVETTEPATTPEATETTPAPTAEAPVATSTMPAGDPAARLGTPTGSDPMDSYQKWTWPTDDDSFLKVDFKDGFLQMTGLTSSAGWRVPLIQQQTNTYIELTANSGDCTAKDSYGIIFRIPVFKDPTQGYLYEVTCDGYYHLWKWNGEVQPKGASENLIAWKQSTDIKTGKNQTNRLGVMVVGNNMKVYINGVLQGEANNSAFNAGFFGVFVRSASSSKYTVKFDEMKYWENPK